MKKRPRGGRSLGGAVLVGLLAGLGGGCATNPVTGEREFALMSEAQEIQIGEELDVEIGQEMGVYDDPELQAYVEDIVLRMAQRSHRPDLPWHFTIVDVPVVNAFALPGGYIYITRGILSYLDSETQLAGVLGHEIGHVTARHAVQQYSRAAGGQIGLMLGSIFVPQTRPFTRMAETGLGILFLKYGRDAEMQSDRLGAEYAAQVGWEPSGVPEMLTTLARLDDDGDGRGVPNWLASHPEPLDRVEEVMETVRSLQATRPPEEFVVARDDYRRRLEGLVFGDNPEEGVVRGSTFLHPDLRLSVEFPEGWEIINGRTQVVARRPGDDAFMFLRIVEQPQGQSLGEVASQDMRGAGLRIVDGDLTTINGLQAYVGSYRGSVDGVGDALARAAHIEHGRYVVAVIGLASQTLFDGAVQDYAKSIRSFRPLDRDEAQNIRPNLIALYVVRRGDTWQSIAQRMGQGNVKATTLAIMNGYPVNEQPQPGDHIKIVVAG